MIYILILSNMAIYVFSMTSKKAGYLISMELLEKNWQIK